MQHILVSIEANLPSSIALRYACRLAGLCEAKVQVIHVKEPEEAGPAVGAGWARLTWQKDLLAQAHQEITQLLRDDLTHCATLSEPIVAVGDRDSHLLAELGRSPYDLLVEGLPAPPGASTLHHTLHTHTMQKAHCPVLLALTMAPLERALVCLDGVGLHQVECFGRLLNGTGLKVDLAGLEFQGAEPATGEETLRIHLAEAKGTLADLGFAVQNEALHPGRPAELATLADDYGLIVAPLPRESGHERQWEAFLGHLSTSMLLC
ncbi:MAG: universal stress protein [Deltaproteobacteria bacterium]|nr:universal stress protein [Deltaproteobacteria bacterium]